MKSGTAFDKSGELLLEAEEYTTGAARRLKAFCDEHQLPLGEMALIGHIIFNKAYMMELMDKTPMEKRKKS